ncbi:MAG: hypothetical protein ABGZ36_16830, partial [Actinomycetota bacterium]
MDQVGQLVVDPDGFVLDRHLDVGRWGGGIPDVGFGCVGGLHIRCGEVRRRHIRRALDRDVPDRDSADRGCRWGDLLDRVTGNGVHRLLHRPERVGVWQVGVWQVRVGQVPVVGGRAIPVAGGVHPVAVSRGVRRRGLGHRIVGSRRRWGGGVDGRRLGRGGVDGRRVRDWCGRRRSAGLTADGTRGWRVRPCRRGLRRCIGLGHHGDRGSVLGRLLRRG